MSDELRLRMLYANGWQREFDCVERVLLPLVNERSIVVEVVEGELLVMVVDGEEAECVYSELLPVLDPSS